MNIIFEKNVYVDIPFVGLLHNTPLLFPERRGVRHDQEPLGPMEGQKQHWLRPRFGTKLDCNAGNELTVASTDPWVLLEGDEQGKSR